MDIRGENIKSNGESAGQIDDQDFPALPKAGSCRPVKIPTAVLPSYHTRTTEVLEIPLEERRFVNQENENPAVGKRFNVQTKVCMDIARDTNVEMNVNTSKNHVLTIIISGEPGKVAEAKKRVAAELQQQETVRIPVPVEYRGYLIGRKGERLQELESSTMTRIIFPPNNALDPNVVIVSGPRRGIIEAEQLIHEIVNRQSQQGFERLSIPKIYHPFICGPNSQFVNDLKSRTDTKINIPPPSVPVDEITVSGKREGVAQAVKEIKAIYQERLETTKTMVLKVARSQHRIIYGQRGSGVADIMAQTGVSVELPLDDGNEEIVLRGKPEDLGRAVSMVYQRAQSSVLEEIEAPHRFHRLLIGKGGASLSELLDGYKRVQVNFKENSDKIIVEGPSEEVEVIVERLRSRLEELQSTVAMSTIKVNPKYYRHIIGKQGATIGRFREYRVRVLLPNSERGDSFASDEVVIEGDPAGVEKAKLEIQKLVEKLENEKCKDVIIDPHIQSLLRSNVNGNPPYIRAIYDAFPQVRIIWPESESTDLMFAENPTKSIVQLRGDRQQVDGAGEKLQKLIKQVIEENYRQEIHILKGIRASFLGREFPKVRKLLDDTHTRLQFPNPNSDSDVFTVIGREENVRQVIEQLEEMQKKLACAKEVMVSIPSALTTKFAGEQAPSLRSICEQCEGVHIRFANKGGKNQSNRTAAKKLSHMDIIVLGPEKEVDQACALLAELNAKVSELCAEEIVRANPRFHGILIGRHASNIILFRKKHNVELIFPDRLESDPNLASEIRIVGTKESVGEAKRHLESVIKSLEDEVEESVAIDWSILKEIIQYRRSFPTPELDGVRVIIPRYANYASYIQPDSDNSMGNHYEPLFIKLLGSKACVETALHALNNIIKEVKEQVTQEFPLTDPSHIIVLERNRSQLPELERMHKVYIRLIRSTENSEPNYSTLEERFGNSPEPHVLGILTITGVRERINQAFEDGIKPLLPIEDTFPVPQEFHRSLIAVPTEISNSREQSRRLTRGVNNTKQATPPDQATNTTESLSKAIEIRRKYSVTIRLPPQHPAGSNFIFLRGTPSNIAAAKHELTEWLKECEAAKADRIARNYEEAIDFPHRFLQTILGMRADICSKHEVVMRLDTGTVVKPAVLPPSPSPLTAPITPAACEASSNNTVEISGDITFSGISQPLVSNGDMSNVSEPCAEVTTEKQARIILRGYQDHVSAAKAELTNTIAKLLAEVTENLFIPVETHARLIGTKGSAILKVMREYNVRIDFPNRRNINSASEDVNTVLVSGAPENVDMACDYLITKANEFLAQSESSNVRHRLLEEEI
ncbi:unnamed protein product [Trichobilharzia szidati]|nr:unnamed protein product [Trichobilharzia szidati]CAH8872735.1 unnamed protein product [Trichobilharzia szidati]